MGGSVRKAKVDREYPSLSILCEMFGAASDPQGLAEYYGTFGTQQAQAYAEACAALGDRLHKALEALEQGQQANISDPREQYMVELIYQWLKQTRAKPVAIEEKLDSKLLNFSCRVDRVYTFADSPLEWVVDFKTSSSLSDKYRMQLAGYALGWWEKTGRWVDQGILLRVEKSPKKKPQLEVMRVYELHRWLEPLVLCRQLWSICNRKEDYKDL